MEKKAKKQPKVVQVKVRTFVIIAICFAVLVLSFMVVKASLKKKGAGFGGFAAFPMGPSAVSVKTETVSLDSLQDYVNTSGEVQTQSSIDVFPSIGGKIVRVYVSLGSYVKKGQRIADVDPNAPGDDYAYSPVYAPISGTVTRTPLKVGTTVMASTSITTIGDVANLQITARIPERFVGSLKKGLKADVTLQAYEDQVFSASVTRVSPVVDNMSRTKEIILNFDDKTTLVDAGMFAKIKLFTDVYEGHVTVPENCVIKTDEDNSVFILNQDGATVHKVQVKLGKSVDGRVQVLEGLQEGDRVVTEGFKVLAEGAQVMDITKGGGSQEQKEPESAEQAKAN